MAMSDKKKQRVLALVKQLKEQKGINIKQKELVTYIADLKKGQAEIKKVQDEYPDSPAVAAEAKSSISKLNNIINDLNEYMKILHPEGLLDMGSGSSGKAVMGQG